MFSVSVFVLPTEYGVKSFGLQVKSFEHLESSQLEKPLSSGIIAGIIAGILKDIPDAFFHYGLKITQITFWDYSGVIALGHLPSGAAEYICAVFFEIIFSILVGLFFVFVTNRIIIKHYFLSGAFYGAVVWFMIRSVVVGLNIQLLMDGDIVTATINSFNSIMYGLILAIIIRFLENRTPNREI